MAKIVPTPMVENINALVFEPVLSVAEHKGGKVIPHPSLIGSLLYHSTHTRSDIQFSVSIPRKFVSNPTSAYCVVVGRLLQYFQGAQEIEITIGAITAG